MSTEPPQDPPAAAPDIRAVRLRLLAGVVALSAGVVALVVAILLVRSVL